MSLAKALGIEEKEVIKEEKYKTPHISPFDFVNAIHYTKEQLIVDDWSEKEYHTFVINRSLSFGMDTAIDANEMNARPHIPKKFQNIFLINTIRPRKRFNKWLKAENVENLDLVKQYYGYSNAKAMEALRILTPKMIEYIKEQLFQGGRA